MSLFRVPYSSSIDCKHITLDKLHSFVLSLDWLGVEDLYGALALLSAEGGHKFYARAAAVVNDLDYRTLITLGVTNFLEITDRSEEEIVDCLVKSLTNDRPRLPIDLHKLGRPIVVSKEGGRLSVTFRVNNKVRVAWESGSYNLSRVIERGFRVDGLIFR
uniref:Uncharacterized protein n=1 Tax=Grapevine virus F TaxID=1221437 RepID=A0A6B9SCX9_9VIRU|nr:hypothetical protein [Grapevine virus F]UGS43957.1 hypothetical protein [Grapevine virus F]